MTLRSFDISFDPSFDGLLHTPDPQPGPGPGPSHQVSTPIHRLFTKPITLVSRTETGEDEYGQPILTETKTTVLGYYRQIRTGDTDVLAATVVYENIEVFLPANTPLGPYEAVEIDIHGLTERMEIIGQPAEEWNARVGEVNHLKMLVRRAAP